MFTYKIYRRDDDALFLRIVNNRSKSELNTGLKLTLKELDKIKEGGPASRRLKIYRTLESFDRQIREIQNEYFAKGKADAPSKQIRDYIRARVINADTFQQNLSLSGITFAQFYQKREDMLTNRGYKVTYAYTKKKIIEFTQEKSDITPHFYSMNFENVTTAWLLAFNDWLAEKNIAVNSRNIIFRNIRTVMNRALDEELTDKYPFRRFKIKAGKTRKRSMPVEELRRLFDYPCEPHQEFYRDIFKLMFMLCGINTIDLYHLKEIKNGRIEYRRAKTKRLYSIKVEPEAMEIINRYRGEKNLLCIADRWKDDRDFNRQANKALKKIGKVEISGRGGKKNITPEWPNISTYWARHTWATIAYNECDVRKDIVSQALGHSYGSTVTDIYLDKSDRLVDEANRRVLDLVLYGKKEGQRRSNTLQKASSEQKQSASPLSYSLTNTLENESACILTYAS